MKLHDLARRAIQRLHHTDEPLLSFADARRELDLVGQRYIGIRAIPIERVVGSVDRWSDFDRSFRPTCRMQRDRVAELRRVFTEREFPPVSVYELDGAYFVLDGHHRLALARERGMLDIDAEVTRILGRRRGPEFRECVALCS
jgi:hypothetical protein